MVILIFLVLLCLVGMLNLLPLLMHFIRPGDSEVICYHKVPMVMQVYNNNITEQKVSLFCFLNLRSFIRFIFHISKLQFYYLITSYITCVRYQE